MHDADNPASESSGGESNSEQATQESEPVPVARRVPNTEEPGSDTVLSPTTIMVPMVLIENSIGDRYWHPEPMDHSTAQRFAESLECHHAGSATVFYVPIIMPMGSDVGDMISDFRCEPLRAEITETPLADPFAAVAEHIRAERKERCEGPASGVGDSETAGQLPNEPDASMNLIRESLAGLSDPAREEIAEIIAADWLNRSQEFSTGREEEQ